jgi:endonuclease/exonuclease/phosphatase family metal-dependent hydrolase
MKQALPAKAIRVASYNIHKGVWRELFGLRKISRIHELREKVHELQADLIFLQEVQGRHDRHAQRFQHWPEQSQDNFLAQPPATYSGVIVGPAYEAVYGRNANYLHGHHGNALLSRFDVISRENRDFSDHALEKRGVLHCVVAVNQIQVHCFVVHFGLFAKSRWRQTQALVRWIGEVTPASSPLLIAGDFNDWRDQLSPVIEQALGAQEVFAASRRTARPARTFPALLPWLSMDRIYQRGFTVQQAKVHRGPSWAGLSDHSPLVADLLLG